MIPLSRTSRTILKQTEFATTPDILFDAFVNPDVLKKWFVVSSGIDLFPGGSWWFDFGGRGGGRISGQYVYIERPNRLVWSWNEWNVDESGTPMRNDPEGDPPWAVTICDISIVDYGSTSGFRLRHFGYPDMPSWDDLYHGVNAGWDEHLEKLRTIVEIR